MTIYSLDILLSQFWTSLLFHVILTVVSWPVYRFLRRQVRWFSIPISLRIFQFVVIHTVKGLSNGQWNRSRYFSGILSLSLVFFFCMIQQMLRIWSLVPLPFLNPACTSGSSQFMFYWNLALRILSIILLVCEWAHLCSNLNILCHCLSLDWNENWPFPVLWPSLNFLILLAYWLQHYHGIIF